MWLSDAYMKHFKEQLELLCRNDWKNFSRHPNPACISPARHDSCKQQQPAEGSVYGPRVQTALFDDKNKSASLYSKSIKMLRFSHPRKATQDPDPLVSSATVNKRFQTEMPAWC